MPDALKKLFLTLTQLPLLGGLWLWWDQIKVRPAYTVAITILYELGVFALAFSKKVWAKIEDKAVERTANWIVALVGSFAPGFRRRYKKQVINDHGIFNVRGLGLINTYTLSLDQVFVDLRIDPSNPQKFNIDPIARKEFEGNRPIWNFLSIDKSKTPEAAALAVIGPPGSGKTTLLQHMALILAANRQRRYQSRAYTPILLFLRDHIEAITRERPPTLAQLVQDYFGDSTLFPTLKPPVGWFEKQMEHGECMILLDGLDEVAELQQRRAVSTWVDNQIKNYPRCRFVLTARPQGYRDAPLHRAHVLEVQPFNAKQVRKFIESWYLANEIMSSGGCDDAGVRQRANKDANDLLQRLRVLPALSALMVNPLLLTMIAMVHRYHGALPGTRVELYAEICEVLLGRWRQTRGVHDRLKAAQKLVVLQPLAAHMMQSKLREISAEEALPVVLPPLNRVGVMGDEAKNFFGELQASSGLLLEREAGRWSFAHLTFQEYLAAARWLEQKNSQRNWSEFVGDSWWHETLRLYAAQGDATSLVKACLEVDTIPALTLAADCLDEARELDPNIRHATEERVIADLESSDSARRRLAAEVHLSRRLKLLQSIDELREIDLGYLTCAEYQLFLDDMRTQGKYYQPDHWTDFTYLNGQAREPITGLRYEDAAAFCEWLTERQGGDIRYRLPQYHEASQYPSTVITVGTWCRKGDAPALVGLSDSAEQAIKRQLDDISNADSPSPSLFDIEHARKAILNHEKSVEKLDKAIAVKGLVSQLDQSLRYIVSSMSNTERQIGISNAQILARRISLVEYRRHMNLAHIRDLNRRVEFNSDLISSIRPACEVILSIAPKLDLEFASVVRLIKSQRTLEALQILQTLQRDKYTTMAKTAMLISDIVSLTDAEAVPLTMARKTQRQLLSQSFEQSQSNLDIISAWWWLQIVMAREEGKLSAWEGIRIVREHLSELTQTDPIGL